MWGKNASEVHIFSIQTIIGPNLVLLNITICSGDRKQSYAHTQAFAFINIRDFLCISLPSSTRNIFDRQRNLWLSFKSKPFRAVPLITLFELFGYKLNFFCNRTWGWLDWNKNISPFIEEDLGVGSAKSLQQRKRIILTR